MTITSFAALATPDAKTLILGTMPGIQSLQMQQYYGNQQNHFWKIMFTLFQEEFTTDYEIRKKMLLKNNIALWDVLQACERSGSLDSAIVKEVPNDFNHFLKNHPAITHIFFNGQAAAKYFKKYVSVERNYTLVILPSTSPAHAGMPLDKKLALWQEILQGNLL
ncbi:DNA-deoxyinosine glycosylase [Flavobacterium phycosphaerae]|uniref:DNA-deoxyinosine glycosylase n=1 Tax=Flavobacterium phycosphaerae TaxID=2697515 RepID=UPI0013899A3B|nr:DNA-deoxyinosine glycosylase [Flavobacterium phycosphaerae]